MPKIMHGIKLATDSKNDDTEIINHPDIIALMKEKNNRRICWDCSLHNFWLKQKLSRKHKLNKRLLLECKGKLLKFKDLKEKPNVSKTEVATASASISSSKPFNENSDEELNRLLEEMDTSGNDDNSDFELQNYTVGISINSPFTKNMIPNYTEMLKTREVPDKQCILCQKKNMDLNQIFNHYIDDHDLTMGEESDDEVSTFEEWVEAYNKAKAYDSDKK